MRSQKESFERSAPFEVRDQSGRRRFHGAFTGGFSAGYFNTVGSRDGFTPAAFSSTRGDERPRGPRQSARDFMDEEDGIAGLLCVRSDFLPSAGAPQRGGSPFGRAQAPRNVGYAVLRALGWREGRGIGPRRSRAWKKEAEDIARASLKKLPAHLRDQVLDGESVTFAPKAAARALPPEEDGGFGLGFDVYAGAPEFRGAREAAREQRSAALGTRVRMDGSDTAYGEDDPAMAHLNAAVAYDTSIDVGAAEDGPPPAPSGAGAPPSAGAALSRYREIAAEAAAQAEVCSSDGMPAPSGWRILRPAPPAARRASRALPQPPPGWQPSPSFDDIAAISAKISAQLSVAAAAPRGSAVPPSVAAMLKRAEDLRLARARARARDRVLGEEARRVDREARLGGIRDALKKRFVSAGTGGAGTGAAAAPPAAPPPPKAPAGATREVLPFAPDKLLCKRFGVAAPAVDAAAERAEKGAARGARGGSERDALESLGATVTAAAAAAADAGAAGAGGGESDGDGSELSEGEAPLPRPMAEVFAAIFGADGEDGGAVAPEGETEQQRRKREAGEILRETFASKEIQDLMRESDAREEKEREKGRRRERRKRRREALLTSFE